jgi:toxin HigB-1
MALPGARPHPLPGDRAGQWSVSISANWRVIFEFQGKDVTNVDLVDYH